MREKISVIVPVYGVEKMLARCVESILAQTYENIELVLVDDGSPDQCPAICDQYAEKYKNIVVIHKKNGGLTSAWKAGVTAATGDLLGFVDSDDWICLWQVWYLIMKIRTIRLAERGTVWSRSSMMNRAGMLYFRYC